MHVFLFLFEKVVFFGGELEARGGGDLMETILQQSQMLYCCIREHQM